MLKQTSVFALALISGSAMAGPIANAVGGLLGAGGAPTGALSPVTTPLVGGINSIETAAQPVTNSAPLPGLSPNQGLLPGSALPVGVTVLNDGTNPNSGYDDVARLGNTGVVTSAGETGDSGRGTPGESGTVELNNSVLVLPGTQPEPLVTPYLLTSDGNGGAIDAAVFDGDGTANASPTMGIGAAVGSGSNTGNGTIGIGIANNQNTGNGSAIGIAALSDESNGATTSGNGGQLGVSLLNQGDALTICGAGMCGGVSTLQSSPAGGLITTPANPLISATVLNPNDNQANNPAALVSAAVLSGNNSGNGGTIALGVLSGNNTGQGGLIGAGVVTGNNSATGPLAVGVLTGNNSVITNDGAGPAAGTGGVLALGVLTGNDSVKGTGSTTAAPVLGVAAITGNNSANDAGTLVTNARVLGGGNAPLAAAPPAVTPGGNPDDNDESAQKDDDSQLCQVLAKDNRGRVQGKLREKAQCNIKKKV